MLPVNPSTRYDILLKAASRPSLPTSTVTGFVARASKATSAGPSSTRSGSPTSAVTFESASTSTSMYDITEYRPAGRRIVTSPATPIGSKMPVSTWYRMPYVSTGSPSKPVAVIVRSYRSGSAMMPSAVRATAVPSIDATRVPEYWVPPGTAAGSAVIVTVRVSPAGISSVSASIESTSSDAPSSAADSSSTTSSALRFV